ncbi:FecR family protein [Flavobacterium capsici]|uniref:FecR family protein n=1 Tax=Flavobacterium capsici TaxID=3075618 RepID=A0AA96EUK1_9FLAO|nr:MULTISPECIES: FecR family protein [unclassified Flavobacterium]WNM18964.1 FecR family protein [Flavobacterium sp. PMR2A8]WNM23014.1 FecR family protein [Flavobacterium sp. PMTSA4]
MEENYPLADWLNNETSDETLKNDFSEDDISIFSKIKKYSAQLETPAFDEQKILTNILSSPKQKVVHLNYNWIFKIAALFIIILGLYFSFTFLSNTNFTAENGSETALILPDESEVILNSGSNLSYKKWNWENNRLIELEGEAFFKVAKGKKFEVNTTAGKVTVLGTQFNVKQRNNRFEVTCYEGKVKVTHRDKIVILTKGMKTIFENDKSLDVPNTYINQPEWINDEIVFYKENLKNIISEIERKYNVTIELNSSNNQQVFSGNIPSNNLDVALGILTKTYHLKIAKKTANKITLTEINVQK